MLSRISMLSFALFFTLFANFSAFAGEIVLEGVFHGTNLYVQNPSIGQGKFCIEQVFVNDQKLESVPKASAFEISLNAYLKLDQKVTVRIFHSDGCEPKVINPNAIRQSETFQFVSIDVNAQNIHWVGKGEKKFGKYFIEKYLNNSWTTVDVVNAQAKPGNNVYTIDASHHSGQNKIRVKYVEITGKIFYSKTVEYTSSVEAIKFYPEKVSKELNFSKPTQYEILDFFGNKVKEGNGDKVDCTDLKSGFYYVNFDNRTERFYKK